MKAALLVLLGLAGADAFADDRQSLAVLNIKTNGVEERFGPLLIEVLSAELVDDGRFDVIAGRDVESMLGFEAQKQMLGCSDSECLLAIAGAMGADLILVGDVGRIGDTFVVNFKIINIRNAKTIARTSKTPKGDEGVLVTTVRASVEDLLAQVFESTQKEAVAMSAAPNADTATTPLATNKDRPSSKKGIVGVGPIVLWSLGAASLITGGVFGGLALDDAAFANSGDVGSQLAIGSAQQKQLGANIAFAGGGALLAGGLAWFLVDFLGAKKKHSVGMMPARDGATLVFVGEF